MQKIVISCYANVKSQAVSSHVKPQHSAIFSLTALSAGLVLSSWHGLIEGAGARHQQPQPSQAGRRAAKLQVRSKSELQIEYQISHSIK